MATATDRTVEINNLGPIEHLEFALPEKGVLELVGRCGVGKSIALKAIAGAFSGDELPPVRDGQLKGDVRIGGLRVTVAKRSSRKGETDIRSLESDFSLDDFVAGGNIKDPESADARRVRVVVRLLRAKVEAERFRSLVSDEDFARLVKPEDLDGDDLVAVQERIKRRFEAGTRQARTEAENCLARARAKAAEAEGVDMTAPSDETALRAAHTEAVADDAQLRAEAKAAQETLAKAEEGRRVLAEAEARYDGLSIADASAAVEAADAVLREKRAAQDELWAQLEALKARFAAAQAETVDAGRAQNAALETLKASERHFALLDGWRKSIDAAANVAAIPAEALEASASRVTEASRAIETGAIIRKARAAADAAEAERAKAQEHLDHATRLDEAAKGTEEILSEVVASSGVPLKIKQGRLWADKDGVETLFGRLSDGERTIRGLDLMINAVKCVEDAVITCGQQLWANLDPALKAECAQKVEAAGALMVTVGHSLDDGIGTRMAATE